MAETLSEQYLSIYLVCRKLFLTAFIIEYKQGNLYLINVKIMVKTKEISELNRGAILALHEEGYSTRTIAQKGYASKTAVANIIKRFHDRGTSYPLKSPGRPPKTTKRDDRLLVRNCLANRRQSSRVLARQWVDSIECNAISSRTVRRRLCKANLKSYRPAKKPFINQKQRERRLRWCHEHKNWSLDQWRTVIFSDESKFQLFSNKGTVRRRPGERYKPECLQATVKFPDSAMIWSCMSYHGVGRMFLLEKNARFNARLYQGVLENRLLLSANEWFPNGGYLFQDDGAPCHRAKSVVALKERLHIPSLDWWPGQSPDLNVIENLWNRVDQLVSEIAPKTRQELIGAIIRVWNHVITQDLLHNLIDSMPRRIEAVINAKGYATKY